MNKTLEKLLRTHFLAMQGYISAGMESDKAADTVFLNANENPYALPGLEDFNRYPQPQPKALLEGYAKLYGVGENNIVATRGADEAIVLLTKLFCEPNPHCLPRESGYPYPAGKRSPVKPGTANGDAILICPPTFGMYGVNGRGAPVDVIEVPLLKQKADFALDVEGIKAALSSSPPRQADASLDGGDPEEDGSKAADLTDTVRANSATPNANGMTGGVKLVFLCSPNNPTGNSFAREDLLEIINAAAGRAIVVLDETYIEFAKAHSLTDILSDHPHLMILRTLSKSYAMAGMRMGCLLNGDPDFIALARAKVLDAYPLPRASIEAALHVMRAEMQEIARGNIEKILAERERMTAALSKIDIIKTIFTSDANFLLVEMERAHEFCAFTKENGVILRDFSSKPETENCIRLSIGTPEENDLVLKLLEDFE